MSRTGSGIVEHGKPHRLMAVWTAAHDNGWVTSVVENPDGTFAAWAAPDGEGAGVYTIQADVDSGKAAAEAALQRHTTTRRGGLDFRQRLEPFAAVAHQLTDGGGLCETIARQRHAHR